jgi:hypothetical protein
VIQSDLFSTIVDASVSASRILKWPGTLPPAGEKHTWLPGSPRFAPGGNLRFLKEGLFPTFFDGFGRAG